jgi:hypothetical protein
VDVVREVIEFIRSKEKGKWKGIRQSNGGHLRPGRIQAGSRAQASDEGKGLSYS